MSKVRKKKEHPDEKARIIKKMKRRGGAKTDEVNSRRRTRDTGESSEELRITLQIRATSLQHKPVDYRLADNTFSLSKMKILHSSLWVCLLLFACAAAKDLPQSNEVDSVEKDQLDLIAEDESQKEEPAEEEDASLNEVEGGYKEDPCLKVRCGAGRVCEVNEKGEGQCVCIPECPQETDSRRKICSNHNETWSSDCEVYRMRCLCTEEDEECTTKKYKHVHVDYYGECRDIPKCSDDEMEDFPRRMREWLFNVMHDLAQRHELDDPYLELEQEAERDLAKKWSNAVIWKYCELDSHPYDRSVSRHELFPIRAPLLAMEHCIAPFLDKCDGDDDHRIDLKEWGLCLGLQENEIEDKCAAIRDRDQ